MSKKRKTKKTLGLTAVVLAAAVCIAAILTLIFLPKAPSAGPAPSPSNTAPQTSESVQIELDEQHPINLGYGLEITDAGRYTGLYMEGGGDEIVSDVMMIVIRNNGEQDVQLGRITAVCGQEEYHFVLTNLAAGAKVILLDQDRKASSGAQLTSAVLENSAFFEEPMDVMADVIQISGLNGMLNVKNISDTDIHGDIYIYYKYAAQDIYYGGITFRVRVEGGLKSGELRQIPAGHYSPDGCAIVQVMTHE